MNEQKEQRPMRLLSIGEVQQRVSMGRSTIYARIKAGRFPRPVSVSPGMVRWRDADIDAWIASLPTTDELVA